MNIVRLFLIVALALGLNAEAQTKRAKSTKKKPAATKRAPASKQPAPELTPATPVDAPTAAPVATPKTDTPAPAPEATVQAPPPAPAPANTTVVIAAPRNGLSQAAATSLQEELTRQLAKKPGVQLVDLGSAFPPPPPASLQEADALYEEGKSLYDNLDPEAAAGKFISATEAYEKHPAAMRPERLAKAFLFLGASQILNGDKDGAKASFLRALAADPNIQPDSNLFDSTVQSLFTDTEQEFTQQASGTLVIDSRPQGARVTVRGEDVGVTPLKSVPVHAGRHPVVITLPGYTPYASYPQVGPAKTAELKPELEPLPGLAAVLDSATRAASERSFDASTMPPEVGAIADRLSARYVVLAGVTEKKKGRVEAELQAWDIQTKSRLRGVEIDPRSTDPDESIAGAVDRVHGFLLGGPLSTSESTASRSMPDVIKKPWFWAAVVGGAAVVTGGIVYATQADKGRPGGPITGFPGLGF